MNRCRYCGGTIEEDTISCPHCAREFIATKRCSECGKEIPEYATKCKYCDYKFVGERNIEVVAINAVSLPISDEEAAQMKKIAGFVFAAICFPIGYLIFNSVFGMVGGAAVGLLLGQAAANSNRSRKFYSFLVGKWSFVWILLVAMLGFAAFTRTEREPGATAIPTRRPAPTEAPAALAVSMCNYFAKEDIEKNFQNLSVNCQEDGRRDEVSDLGGGVYQVKGYCTATNRDDRTVRSVIGYDCKTEQRVSDWLLLELVFP